MVTNKTVIVDVPGLAFSMRRIEDALKAYPERRREFRKARRCRQLWLFCEDCRRYRGRQRSRGPAFEEQPPIEVPCERLQAGIGFLSHRRGDRGLEIGIRRRNPQSVF